MSELRGNVIDLPEISGQINSPRGLRGGIGAETINIGGTPTPTQEKNIDITTNGAHIVTPDEEYALLKVTANVNVPIPEGYIKPSGSLEITENGSYDITEKASVAVNVATGGDSSLPAGYSRADYIRFTGEQIVDTRIVCNQNTRIRVVFTREKSTQHYLYGVASSDNTASVTAYLGGSWRFGNKTATKTIITNKDMIYSGVVDNSKITVTGNAATISGVNEFETVGSLLLGACRSSSGGIGAAQFEGPVLLLEIWQGGEQAQKLVPVTDGTIFRFWDKVSKTFFDSITDTPLDGGNL